MHGHTLRVQVLHLKPLRARPTNIDSGGALASCSAVEAGDLVLITAGLSVWHETDLIEKRCRCVPTSFEYDGVDRAIR
jgi:hypothetical protein